MSNTSTIPTTKNEGSWCVVAPFFGAIGGAIITSYLMDIIGRKNAILITAPVQIFFCICLGYAWSIYQIIAIRFFVGTVDGALFTVLPVYIAEICESKRRSLLVSGIPLLANVGRILIYSVGPIFSIYATSMMIIGITAIHFGFFVFMPESPYYLIKKQEYEKAHKCLERLRSSSNVKIEFEELCTAVQRQEGEEQAKYSDLLNVASNKKATIIFLIICCGTKFSGHEPLVFYSQSIFEETGSSIDPKLAIIIFAFVEFSATLLTILFIDKFGKKILTVVSILGCGIVMLFLATHVILKEQKIYPIELNWIPLFSVVLYTLLYSIGLNFAQSCAVGELFPTSVKGKALASADIFSNVMIALTSKFFQITNTSVGIYLPFYVFSFCCFVFGVLIIKYVQ